MDCLGRLSPHRPDLVARMISVLAAHSPFHLQNDTAYRQWREWKLANYPASSEELVVEVEDARALTDIEHRALLQRCAKTNMALYACRNRHDSDKNIPRLLGQQFGLNQLDHNLLADEDGMTSLMVANASAGERREYIPYTNLPMKWHTDGYYNPSERRIWAFQLHCVQSAASGGENALLDHEIAYILLRDENPDFIRALMVPNVMTIPPRMDEEGVARAEETGPVFSLHPHTGDLHMRYTARTRSIVWKQDEVTSAAVAFLEKILASDLPYIFRVRLQPGMGLLTNNVLHDRTGFSDTEQQRRLFYRARYYDRIAGTSYPAK